jgi:hypothetical protein
MAQMAQMAQMAPYENDRIERMKRAMSLFIPQQSTVSMFQTAEQLLSSSIAQMENDLRTQVRNFPSVIPTDLHARLGALKDELTELRQARQNIMRMVYRTIRDTYNADAAVAAQIDV